MLHLLEFSVKPKNLESTKCKRQLIFSWLRDFLLKHEKLKNVLKVDTMHVIDHTMEYDNGIDNPYFPEYRTRLASKVTSYPRILQY